VSTRAEESRKPKKDLWSGFDSLSSKLGEIGIQLSVLDGHKSEIEYKLLDPDYENALFGLLKDCLRPKLEDPLKEEKKISKVFLTLEEGSRWSRTICKYSISRKGMIINLKYDPRSDEFRLALLRAIKLSSTPEPTKAK
jgi:hypothetical protein